MHSVGEKLRNERQRQNRSISAIASETCINSRYLEAIESDDLSILPGGFFYKSFVKQYSGVLGIDFSSLEAEVDRVKPPEVQDPLPALSVSYQIAKTEGRVTRFPLNKGVWAGALLVVTLAGGGGFYAWWQKRQRGPGDSVPDPVQVVQAAPAQSTPPVQQVPVAVTEPAPQTPTPAADAQPSPTPAPVAVTPSAEPPKSEAGKLSVGLSATERTWVSLSSDGKTVFSGVLDASQTKNIEGVENAKLLTGNAAGLDVRWNGKSIGPLGTHGQVRVVVFTPENFQIISPRKM
jgi:cytoskeletal protein RodZ